MKYDIFISYRRDGGDTLAQLIYDRLCEKGYKVFLDIESLRSGKFNEKLLEVIEECKDVIVILPPNALERCKNPEDWLYREVSYALIHRKNIIPVMMKGFIWPDILPEELKELPNYNGIQDSKDYFDAVIDKLMALLVSKTDVFGFYREKIRYQKKKFVECLQKKRIILTVMLVFLVVCTIIAAFFFYIQKREKEQAMSIVMVRLVANEEMSISEYYNAVEIVKKRIDLFAEEENYKIEVSEDMIDIELPLTLFGEEEPIDVITDNISRPVKLYIMDEETMKYIEINKKDIEKIDIVTGKNEFIEETSKDKWLEDKADYTYMDIRFSEELLLEIEECFEENSRLCLVQDRKEYLWSGYYLTKGNADNQFFIVEPLQTKGMYDLIFYNYTSETFEHGFYTSVILPVDWEMVQNAAIRGKYQCNIEELPEEQVIIQYSCESEEVTNGEFLDTITMMKERLDILEKPYAFGYTVTGPYDISIKTSPEHLNNVILESLCNSYGVRIKNPFLQEYIYVYGDEMLDYEENGSIGILKTEFSEIDIEENAFERILETTNQNLYLLFNGYKIGKVNISEQSAEIKEGQLFFEDFQGIKADSEEKRNVMLKYIADYINWENTWISYTHTDVFENPSGRYGIEFTNFVDMEQYQQIVQEICAPAVVSYGYGQLKIELNQTEKDTSPEEMIELIKRIYEALELSKGEHFVEIICIEPNKWSTEDEEWTFDIGDVTKGLNCYIEPENYDYNQMIMNCHWLSEEVKQYPYIKKFLELIEEDPYFDTELLFLP